MPFVTGNPGPPGGVGFSPTSIAGCQLWMDAADTSAASMTLSGSTVTVWKDKSGSGNATTTKIGSPIQSAQGITVTTSDKFYMDPIVNPPTGSYLTFFITATLAATGSQYGRLVSFAKQSDGTTNNDFSSVANFTICQAGTNQQIAIYRNGGPQFTQNITYGTPFLLSIVWDGTNETAYFNGTSLGSVGNTGTFGFNRLGLGVNINTKDTVNDRWAGTMSEILMYYSAFTTTDRQTIEGYLAQKWGLTASLSAGHPGLTNNYLIGQPSVFRITPFQGTHAPFYVTANQPGPAYTLTVAPAARYSLLTNPSGTIANTGSSGAIGAATIVNTSYTATAPSYASFTRVGINQNGGYILAPSITGIQTLIVIVRVTNTTAPAYFLDARTGLGAGYLYSSSGSDHIGPDWTSATYYRDTVNTTFTGNFIAALQDGAWHHVCLQRASFTSAITFLARYSLTETLGCDCGEVMIFTGALTAQQVKDNYNFFSSRFGWTAV